MIILKKRQENAGKVCTSVAKSRTSEYPYPILVGHKSKTDSTSFSYASLLQNKNSKIQVILIFYMELGFPSKHLEFLSLQIVHQMRAGMVSHHVVWLLVVLNLFQLLSSSQGLLSITQLLSIA